MQIQIQTQRKIEIQSENRINAKDGKYRYKHRQIQFKNRINVKEGKYKFKHRDKYNEKIR